LIFLICGCSYPKYNGWHDRNRPADIQIKGNVGETTRYINGVIFTPLRLKVIGDGLTILGDKAQITIDAADDARRFDNWKIDIEVGRNFNIITIQLEVRF